VEKETRKSQPATGERTLVRAVAKIGNVIREIRQLWVFAVTLGLSGCSLDFVDVRVAPAPVARDHPKAGEALVYFLRNQESEAIIGLPGVGPVNTGIGHDMHHIFYLPNHSYQVLAMPAGPATLMVGHKTIQQNLRPGVTYYFLVAQYFDYSQPTILQVRIEVTAIPPARAKAQLPGLKRIILSDGATSGTTPAHA
jgi:hypothetical protein